MNNSVGLNNSFPAYKNSSLVLETMWGSNHRAEEGFEYPVYLRKEKNIYWLFTIISIALVLAIIGSCLIIQKYSEEMGRFTMNLSIISMFIYITVLVLCVRQVMELNDLLKKYRDDLTLLGSVYGHIPFGAKAYNEMSREELQSALMNIFYFHVMRFQLDTSNEENEKELNKILGLLKRFGIIKYNSGVGEYTFLKPLNPDEEVSKFITTSHVEGSLCTLCQILPEGISELVNDSHFVRSLLDARIWLNIYEVTKPVNLRDVHMRGFEQDVGAVVYLTLCFLKKIPQLVNGKYGKEFLIWYTSPSQGVQYLTVTLAEKVSGSKENVISIKHHYSPIVKKGVKVIIVRK